MIEPNRFASVQMEQNWFVLRWDNCNYYELKQLHVMLKTLIKRPFINFPSIERVQALYQWHHVDFDYTAYLQHTPCLGVTTGDLTIIENRRYNVELWVYIKQPLLDYELADLQQVYQERRVDYLANPNPPLEEYTTGEVEVKARRTQYGVVGSRQYPSGQL